MLVLIIFLEELKQPREKEPFLIQNTLKNMYSVKLKREKESLTALKINNTGVLKVISLERKQLFKSSGLKVEP